VNRSDLLKLYKLLARRGWLAAAVGLVTFTLAVLWIYVLMPVYFNATAIVMPSPAALRNPLGGAAASFDERSLDSSDQQDRVAVFMGLAKSNEVLGRTIRALNLHTSLKVLEETIKVTPDLGASFRITAFARTDAEARNLANGIANTLQQYYRERNSAQTKVQSRLLEERMAKLQSAMKDAQKELVELRGNEVSSPIGEQGAQSLIRLGTLLNEADSVKAQLSDLQERRLRTQQELALQPESTTSIVVSSDNPRAVALQSNLGKLEQDLVAARIRYTDKHRTVERLRSQIEQVKKQLGAALGEMVTRKTQGPNPLRNTLENDLVRLRVDQAGLEARLGALRGALARDQMKARANSDKSVTMSTRMADFQAAQENYGNLSRHLQIALLEQRSQRASADIQILDLATTTLGPAPLQGPDRPQLLLLSIILCLLLGLGAAFAVEYLDTSFKSTDEVQAILQLPLSAAVPEVTGEEKKQLPQITRALPVSPYAECYRFLRTNILYGTDRQNIHSIMVCSAIPQQGTSTTTANLALALAEAGKRVVVIDTDFRRPMVHKNFGTTNEAGLSDLLCGEIGLEAALHPSEVEGITLLTAGAPARNPSALLNSERMRELLRELGDKFDYVLLDSPPVLAFSDGLVLSSLLDGVMLVVRAGDSSRGNELQAKIALERAGANILGVVVNGLSSQQVDNIYYHSHYYGHGRALPVSEDYAVEAKEVQH
jgi:capsular exopolysaccharide synthesis family protein